MKLVGCFVFCITLISCSGGSQTTNAAAGGPCNFNSDCSGNTPFCDINTNKCIAATVLCSGNPVGFIADNGGLQYKPGQVPFGNNKSATTYASLDIMCQAQAATFNQSYRNMDWKAMVLLPDSSGFYFSVEAANRNNFFQNKIINQPSLVDLLSCRNDTLLLASTKASVAGNTLLWLGSSSADAIGGSGNSPLGHSCQGYTSPSDSNQVAVIKTVLSSGLISITQSASTQSCSNAFGFLCVAQSGS